MKKITNDQINALLQAFYTVNAPVQTFDAVKKLLTELPDVEIAKPETVTPEKIVTPEKTK